MKRGHTLLVLIQQLGWLWLCTCTVIERIELDSFDDCRDWILGNSSSNLEFYWDGESLQDPSDSMRHCEFRISRMEDDGSMICIRIENFYVDDCKVSLQVYNEYDRETSLDAGCGENEGEGKEMCSHERFVRVKLETPSGYTSGQKIIFLAEKREDDIGVIIAIILGVFGGIVLLIIICVVIACLCIRASRRPRGGMINTSTANPSTAGTTVPMTVLSNNPGQNPWYPPYPTQPWSQPVPAHGDIQTGTVPYSATQNGYQPSAVGFQQSAPTGSPPPYPSEKAPIS